MTELLEFSISILILTKLTEMK